MKLNFFLSVAVLVAIDSPAVAEPLELPSQGLESRVEFWKKIFTQYGEDDIVIHDGFHVNLIYDVADETSVKSRISDVKRVLEEIRTGFETPENLSLPAKQIHASMVRNGVPISAPVLDDLIDGIHTQRGIKERFRQGVIRSGRYVEAFRAIFEREGIPASIVLLPLVESSFENRARSKVGAAGLWQFTRGTGRLYMRVTSKVDERLDPAKATVAAARLLRDNYRSLGSWPLAITAYNHGRGGMLRAQELHGSELPTIIRDYRGKTFGYASMNFYAEFLAAVDVYENYLQHFGELVLDTPLRFTSPAPAKVSATKKAASPRPAAVSDKYRVRSGDTLWEIAKRFGTDIRDLMEKNNLNKTAIYAGQLLLVK
jgi:membrane-bound lytic murein transglycosylase D